MSKTVFDASIGRRHFLKRALGGAAAAVACPTVLRAADAKELNILFPGGTWKDWFEQVFVTPFADQRGIKAVWKTGLGFEPLMIAQRRRPQWDVIHQNQNTSSQLGALNAVVEWSEERHPEPEEDPPVVPLPVPRRQSAHALRPRGQHQADQEADHLLDRPVGSGVQGQGRLP